MDDVQRILVVSRSTKSCRKAIHYGISLSRKYGAQLYVFQVIPDPWERWNLPILNLRSIQEGYKAMQQEAKLELDAIIDTEKAKGMAIKELIREGDPADEVFKVVEEEKIDLIIMLAHGEGCLEHLLFGHDKEKITRKMPCSVLLVREEL